MTLARMVVPNDVISITRRCADRTWFLRPDAALNHGLQYLLGLGAQRYGVLPVAVVVMSDHYHLQAWDVFGRHPEFTQWFHRQVTAWVNHLRGRRGAVWDSTQQVNVARVVDDEAILANAAYILANPVAALAVAHGREWPGVRSTPQSAQRPPARFTRPSFFKNPEWPDEVELRYIQPPTASALDTNDFTRLLATKVAEHEGRHRAHAEAAGLRFAGASAVRRRHWSFRTTTEERSPRFDIKPNVISRCSLARSIALELLAVFRKDYSHALERFRSLGDAVFPPYTWNVAKRFGHAYAPP